MRRGTGDTFAPQLPSILQAVMAPWISSQLCSGWPALPRPRTPDAPLWPLLISTRGLWCLFTPSQHFSSPHGPQAAVATARAPFHIAGGGGRRLSLRASPPPEATPWEARHECLFISGPNLSEVSCQIWPAPSCRMKSKERGSEMAVRTPNTLTGKWHNGVFSCSP